MKRIIAFLVAFALGFNPLAAGATVYWFSDCYTGSEAGCVPGSNSYNGLSRYPGKLDDGVTVNAAYGPKKTWLGFNFGTAAAGDQFLMANGSSMNLYLTQTAAAASTFTAGSPCLVTWNSHGFAAGTELSFVTTGSFPTGTGISGTTVGGIVKAVINANQFSFAYGPQSGAFSCSDSGTGTVTITTKNPTIQNANSTRANPLVWGSYDPPNWTSSGSAPLINVGGTQNCLDFSQGGTSSADAGYYVSNLHFKKIGGFVVGDNNKCITIYQEANDVTLDNVEIEGFSVGAYEAGFASCCTTGDGISKRFTVKWSNFHDIGDIAILQGSDDITIIGTTFTNNGFGGGGGLDRNHHIYLNGANAVPNRRAVVGYNKLTRNSVCQAGTDLAHAGSQCTSSANYGTCQASVIVVHGIMSDLQIIGNYIDETPGATGGCYGIDISPGYATAPDPSDANESFTRARVIGNKLVNVGSTAIGATSCIDCLFDSNKIIWTSHATGYGVTGISIDNSPNWGGGGSTDAVSTRANARNNSIYIDNGTASSSTGIQVYSKAPASTTGHRVNNNLVLFSSTTSASSKCFDWTGLSLGTHISSWDYNWCYRPGGDAKWSQVGTGLLSDAQGLGFDTHSLKTSPNLVSTPAATTWEITTDFSAGLSTNCPKVGYGAKVYTAPCSIGANQSGAGGAAPSFPLFVTVQ